MNKLTRPIDTVLYIAGPMTGYPDENRPAFNDADRQLRQHRYVILNPALTWLPEGQNSWEDYIRAAIRQLSCATAVAHLPGWATSRGAQLERRIARDLKIPWLPVDYWLTWAEEFFVPGPGQP